MSKRNNHCQFDGYFTIERNLPTLHIDGLQVLQLSAYVETDKAALGGRHRLALYGRQALEAACFMIVVGQPLDVSISAWARTMWSDNEAMPRTEFVVHTIRFHVANEHRFDALRILKQAQANDGATQELITALFSSVEANQQK